jgi:hypothetical protein
VTLPTSYGVHPSGFEETRLVTIVFRVDASAIGVLSARTAVFVTLFWTKSAISADTPALVAKGRKAWSNGRKKVNGHCPIGRSVTGKMTIRAV